MFCVSSSSGGSLFADSLFIKLTSCSFYNSTSNNDGGSLALFGDTGLIEKCTFTTSNARGNGGSAYTALSQLSFVGCSILDSGAAIDGGSVCGTKGTMAVVNNRVINSATAGSQTSSSRGGSSIHIFSGSRAEISSADLHTKRVNESLIYIETSTTSSLSDISFFVADPTHDGVDLICHEIPVSPHKNPMLTSSTPNTTFRTVISKLFPLHNFDDWFTTNQDIYAVSQLGSDKECTKTRFCQTLSGSLVATSENINFWVKVAPGDHYWEPTVVIRPHCTVTVTNPDESEARATIHSLQSQLVLIKSVYSMSFTYLAFERYATQSPLFSIETGHVKFEQVLFREPPSSGKSVAVVAGTSPNTINVDLSEFVKIRLPLSIPFLSLEETEMLQITGQANDVQLSSHTPIFKIGKVNDITIRELDLIEAEFHTTLIQADRAQKINLESVQLVTVYLRSPLIDVKSLEGDAPSFFVYGCVFAFESYAPLCSLVRIGQVGISDTVKCTVINTIINTMPSSVPVLLELKTQTKHTTIASQNEIYLHGPISWCRQSNTDLFAMDDEEQRTLHCSSDGVNNEHCGTEGLPCQSLHYAMAICHPRQNTHIVLCTSMRENEILLFNRRCDVSGQNSEIIVTPGEMQSDRPFLFTLRHTQLNMTSFTMMLTGKDSKEDCQFVRVANNSFLQMKDVTLFVIAPSALQLPPVVVEESVVIFNNFQTAQSRISHIRLASSMFRCVNCPQIEFEKCHFTQISTRYRILLAESKVVSKIMFSSCSFTSLRSESGSLVSFSFQSSFTMILTNCSFSQCQSEGVDSSIFYMNTAAAQSSLIFKNVSCDDASGAILLINTPSISSLLKSSQFVGIDKLLPSHFLFQAGSVTTSFITFIINVSRSVTVADNGTNCLLCVTDPLTPCNTLQHILGSFESSPVGQQMVEVRTSRYFDSLLTPVTLGTDLCVYSPPPEVRTAQLTIFLDTSRCGGRALVTVNLKFEIVSFILKISGRDELSPIFATTNKSELCLRSCLLQYDDDFFCPLLASRNATVYFLDTSLSLTADVTSTFLVLDGGNLTISNFVLRLNPLRVDEVFWSIEETRHTTLEQMTLWNIEVVQGALFELTGHDSEMTIAFVVLAGVGLLSESTTVIRMLGLHSKINITHLSIPGVIGNAPFCSQIDITLVNSSLFYTSKMRQSGLEGEKSGSVVIWTDTPSSLHFNTTLELSSVFMTQCPILTLTGKGMKNELPRLVNEIKNRDFGFWSVLWRESADDIPDFVFTDQRVLKGETYVSPDGADRLNCGTAQLPCETLDFLTEMREELTNLSVVLIKKTFLLDRIDHPTLFLTLKPALADAAGVVVGRRENGASFINIDTFSASDLFFTLEGSAILTLHPFITCEDGEMLLDRCLFTLPDQEFYQPLLCVYDSPGCLSDVTITATSFPTILLAEISEIVVIGMSLTAKRISAPPFVVGGPYGCDLHFSDIEARENGAIWKGDFIHIEDPAIDGKLRIHKTSFVDQVVDENVVLIQLSLEQSVTTLEQCLFESITSSHATGPNTVTGSALVVSVLLDKSTLILKQCVFLKCGDVGSRLPLVSLTPLDSSINIADSVFAENTALHSLVVFHSSPFRLFTNTTFSNLSFKAGEEPFLISGEDERPLLPIFTYCRANVIIGVVSASIVSIVIVFFILVFPIYSVLRFCKTHPPTIRFWKKDGGRGLPDEQIPYQIFVRPVQPGTHSLFFLPNEVLEAKEERRVEKDVRIERCRRERLDHPERDETESSDSEDILDSLLDDPIVDLDF
ncbi:hypothetical protein BLNAU_963 [Blattamonas nauphoetae]|uniref:Uncharacterized protein n=1 Tax=Blattamonas nauphoetae TaxID=2049346 RepID=A0ABQ9YJF3_9EUKA|nr:hypothetical protein BLNAU_963 [Blattamonas nauphoetae]